MRDRQEKLVIIVMWVAVNISDVPLSQYDCVPVIIDAKVVIG